MKESSNLEDRICRYQDQSLLYKEMEVKENDDTLVFMTQDTKWSRNHFTCRKNVILVHKIAYRNIAE